MPDKVDLSYALGLKPEKAIEYFKSKGYKISFDWHEVWEEAHAKAFTVSRVTQIEVLKDIRESLQKSLDTGMTYEQFKKDVTPKLQAKGWLEKRIVTAPDGEEKYINLSAPWRLRTIYRTNIQTSYMAGRYKEQLANVDNMPYWEYVAILDSRTRPSHAELNGLIFRYDDPFWASFYPPNGWGCRCRVSAVDADYLKDNNLESESSDGDLSTAYRLVSEDTGELRPVTVYNGKDLAGNHIEVSPDVGWSYNAGQHAWNIDVFAYNQVKNLPEKIKTKFIAEMASSNINKRSFSNLVDTVNIEKIKRGIEQTVGWMSPEILDYLSEKKFMPLTPIITMSDQGILHSIRSVKVVRGAAVSIADMKNIPEIIAKSNLVLYDKQDPALIYVADSDNDKKMKVVIKLNRRDKNQPVNYAVTVGKINAGDLKDKRYEIIQSNK